MLLGLDTQMRLLFFIPGACNYSWPHMGADADDIVNTPSSAVPA